VLFCKKHSGRVQCHAWLNDLIQRALIRAETPAVMEPHGLGRDDGKRPDGLTLVPWQSGCSATWDVTVAHTLATFCVLLNALQVGSAAVATSARKTTKSSTLSASHMFFLVVVETLGFLSDEAHSLITEIGRRPCFAQPIRMKLCSCTNIFQLQFSVSMQCALPMHSQFLSPHCNHS